MKNNLIFVCPIGALLEPYWSPIGAQGPVSHKSNTLVSDCQDGGSHGQDASPNANLAWREKHMSLESGH